MIKLLQFKNDLRKKNRLCNNKGTIIKIFHKMIFLMNSGLGGDVLSLFYNILIINIRGILTNVFVPYKDLT